MWFGSARRQRKDMEKARVDDTDTVFHPLIFFFFVHDVVTGYRV